MDVGAPIPRNTSALHRLAQRLSPGTPIETVPVEPQPWASLNDCFPNVDRMVDEYGGSREYGWQLWEVFPGVLLEAELHAVWVDDRGQRHDITPKQVPLPFIVFVPDPDFVYDGRQVDNVRVALTKDPLAKALIAAYRERFAALNEGELADSYGHVDTPRIRRAHKRVDDVEALVIRRFYGVTAAR